MGVSSQHSLYCLFRANNPALVFYSSAQSVKHYRVRRANAAHQKVGRQAQSVALVEPVKSVLVLKGHWRQAAMCSWSESGEKVPAEQAYAKPEVHH